MGATVYLSDTDFQLLISSLDFIDMDCVEDKVLIKSYNDTHLALNRLRIKFNKSKRRKSSMRP